MPPYNISRAPKRKASAKAFQLTGRRLGDGAQVRDEAQLLRKREVIDIDYKEEEDHDDKNDLTYDPKNGTSAKSTSIEKNKSKKITKKGLVTISNLRRRANQATIVRNYLRRRGTSQTDTRGSVVKGSKDASVEKCFGCHEQKTADQNANLARTDDHGSQVHSTHIDGAVTTVRSGAAASDRAVKVESRLEIKQEE